MVKKKFSRVYQFKITLKDTKPSIWRRIQVPETYTFWDLHVAIQDAMGWSDYHLHQFEMFNPTTGKKVEIGIPDEESEWDKKILSGREHKISDYFTMDNRVAEYTYDFGDNWKHSVVLEEILKKAENVDYPRCVAGKRACPPEDCGGTYGYINFLEIINNPEHEEHKETLHWVGGEFDPEYFDVNDVTFDDPDKRWRNAGW